MKPILRLFTILLVIILLPACQTITKNKTQNKKIQITTTTGIIGDLVENIGGEFVQVTSLMGPGVDPHLYKASQGDIAKLEDAQLIFYNGLNLEGKMTDILNKISHHKPVISVTEKIENANLLKTHDKNIDPHVWFDVQLWSKAAVRVKEALIQLDPSHKNNYELQATNYIKVLSRLDQNVRNQIQQIPKDQKVLVTAHDAFGYFGKAYGIKVVGLQGINTASEYGLKDIQNIVQLLTEKKIKAVFLETSISERSIDAVLKGAKMKNHNVSIGGQLYSDALGTKNTPVDSYVGIVQHNVQTIVKSLR